MIAVSRILNWNDSDDCKSFCLWRSALHTEFPLCQPGNPMSTPVFARSTPSASGGANGSTGGIGRVARIAVQSAAIAALWSAADFTVRRLHLPVPGGVVGLVVLLALL